MSSRYDGKPFLRLLELYVLDAIGELDPRQRATMEGITAKLQTTYKTAEPSWQKIIADQMGFPSTMPELIRQNWVKNRRLGKQNGENLLPQHFAEMFVDANFV